MTYYESKVKRIRSVVYSNQGQLDAVIATRNYIDNNYETDLNLDLLSRTRFVSKYHLLRLFKKYYGQTPRQYLKDKRIEKSKEYLKKGISITETCFAIGFESPSSFSTLFKNRTGLAPTEFQKEQLSQSRSNSDFETLAN
jgi:AraC-like DNA-binding protein